MRILFINRIIGVKQFHLASALSDKYGYKCFFAFTFPYNLKLKLFKPKLIKNKLHNVNDVKTDPCNPFISIEKLNDNTINKIDPDIIYISSCVAKELNPSQLLNKYVLFDVEDSTLFDKDILNENIYKEKILNEKKYIECKNTKIITWGSSPEKEEGEKLFKIKKPSLLIYPLVAKRTLPKRHLPKLEKNHLVYAGSIFMGGKYRDFLSAFKSILENGLHLTVYMSNSDNKYNYNILKELERQHPNFKLRKTISFGLIKEELTQYRIGLCPNTLDFKKTSFTYGMKPLEYAFANVQPAYVGYPVRNLTDGKEFGYKTTIGSIVKDYKHNLSNFDFKGHLMDNNLKKLVELIEK